MQLYPGWSARDNYGYGAKKKKRKKERSADPGGTLSSSARTAVSQGSVRVPYYKIKSVSCYTCVLVRLPLLERFYPLKYFCRAE